MRLCTYSFILLAGAVVDILCDGGSTVDQEKNQSVKSGIPVVISERKTRSSIFDIPSEIAARFLPNQNARQMNDLGSSKNTGGQYTGAYNQNIGSNFGTGLLGGLGVSNVLKAAGTEAEDGLSHTGNRYRHKPRGHLSAGIRSEASGIFTEPSSLEMNARISPNVNTGRVNNLGSSQNTGGENTGDHNQNIGANFGTGLHGGLGGTRYVEMPSTEEFTTGGVQGDVSSAGHYDHRGRRTCAGSCGMEVRVLSGRNSPQINDLGSTHNIGGQHTGGHNQNIGANFGTGLEGGLGVSHMLRTPSAEEFIIRRSQGGLPNDGHRYQRDTSGQMYSLTGNRGKTFGTSAGSVLFDPNTGMRNYLGSSHNIGGQHTGGHNQNIGTNFGTGLDGGLGVSRILRTPSTEEFVSRSQDKRRYRRKTSEQMYTVAGNEEETPGSPVAPSFGWGLGVGDSSNPIRQPLNPFEFPSPHVGGRTRSPVSHSSLPPAINIGSGLFGGTGVSNNH